MVIVLKCNLLIPNRYNFELFRFEVELCEIKLCSYGVSQTLIQYTILLVDALGSVAHFGNYIKTFLLVT